MKILISNSNGTNIQVTSKIATHLKKLGHNIVEDKDASKLDQSIKNVDVVIIEITKPTLKAGYVVANALSEKKVVIALENEKNKDSDSFIQDANSKSLILQTYDDTNILEVIDSSLDEAKGRLDTKFILIISPEIDRYLDWAGQNKRMHKAQIVRNAIENMIKKDREYKDYLEGK